MTFQEYKSAYWSMPQAYRDPDNKLPTQVEMCDAVDGFIADCAFDLVDGIAEVCPSSLNEHGVPSDYTETAHKWYADTNFAGEDIRTCSECRAVDDEPVNE